MEKLITEKDFTTYLKEKGTGVPFVGFESPKYQFNLLQKQLLDGEYGLCCFLLQIDKKNVVGSLTNKRLIILKNKIIGNDIISISINNINDIYIKNKIATSYIIIDTLKETVKLNGPRISVENTYKVLQNSLNIIKNSLINKDELNSNDKYDELKKIKELLDNGTLTQDEFEKEKQKILN